MAAGWYRWHLVIPPRADKSLGGGGAQNHELDRIAALRPSSGSRKTLSALLSEAGGPARFSAARLFPDVLNFREHLISRRTPTTLHALVDTLLFPGDHALAFALEPLTP